jgi:N-acetylmuramoyl-L-alanine amidase
MAAYATRISYDAHDGREYYCKFATLENFINGYWAFMNRSVYSGWEEHADSGEDYIRFIGKIYTPSPNYADRVLALVPEAEALLTAAPRATAVTPLTSTSLGTVVIDPGHGGTKNLPGSSANNAISVSGIKEKKLTLDFSLILRDQLLKLAQDNGETVRVVLTRTNDENFTGSKRAGFSFDEKADVFLSIHFNGGAPNTSGVETFYRAAENGNLNIADDMEFARSIQAGLMKGMKLFNQGAKDRGIKPDTQTKLKALGVLNDTRLGNNMRKSKSVAALAEIEYITNAKVDKLLVSGPDAIKNRTLLLASVAAAIHDHLKS